MVYKSVAVFFCFFFSSFNAYALKDEIDFFNVGQGHAVLINKRGSFINKRGSSQPYAPLLIDAGSTKYPYVSNQKYEWEKGNVASPFSLSQRIIEFWKSSNDGKLLGGKFFLNIIVTHPDDDHCILIPPILQKLTAKSQSSDFSFTVHALLGGSSQAYSSLFRDYPSVACCYSADNLGLWAANQCGFLKSSGCITHLFCPTGNEKDANSWSIITRIQIGGISAMLTGDADKNVKRQMLAGVQNKTELESDILLLPHHGSEGTYHQDWDLAVNPRVIVIGAGPRGGYNHPRGETILQLLELKKGQGRLWSGHVMPHGLQYYCNLAVHQEISNKFTKHLFDMVTNTAGVPPQEQSWHLVWVDLPLYTLWTTGTLYFSEDVARPIFAEAPSGLVGYIAVSEPQYLFPPYARHSLIPLTAAEKMRYQEIFRVIEHKIVEEKEKVNLLKIKNDLSKEIFLINNQENREIYLNLISKILEKNRLQDASTLFFQWMRQAVADNNRFMVSYDDRLQHAATFLMSAEEEYTGPLKSLYKDTDVLMALLSNDLETQALILKTFARSTHPLLRLGDYVKIYHHARNCGLTVEEIDILCPFGFPEVVQLERLVRFFREAVLIPLGESISIIDVIDIALPRKEGKNFKEIAEIIIDACAEYEVSEKIAKPQEELTRLLEKIIHESAREEYFKKFDRCFSKFKKIIFDHEKKKFLQQLDHYFPSELNYFLS